MALARRSLGQTAPNPTVGAVLVADGRVIGRGATAWGGRPHAETIALEQARQAGADPAGATMYVTLEPCAHHGRTPPCAQALVEAGIARVISPFEDPDPRVSGRGFAVLRDAGVAVETGLMVEAARALNAGFLSRISRARPYVTLKLACALDGRIATAAGESRWITGEHSRRRVHMMRAESDAVLIGAGTARTDNPMLDVRIAGSSARSPIRIIADGSLSIPLTSRLVASARDIPLWVLHRPGADPDRISALALAGAEVLEIAAENNVLSLRDGLRVLADRGITRLLCEGGGGLAASLLAADLVDEIAVFSAGMLIGGDGFPAVKSFGLDLLEDAPDFHLERLETIGTDTLSVWRRIIT